MICKNCVHYEICCNEGRDDEALIFCADFFEVVRCKDCKHRSKLTSEDSYGVEDWVCNHDCGCAQCNDNDFCRYGERKEK